MTPPRDFAQILRLCNRWRTPDALAWALGVNTATLYRWAANNASTATGYPRAITSMLTRIDQTRFDQILLDIGNIYRERHKSFAFYRIAYLLTSYGLDFQMEQDDADVRREMRIGDGDEFDMQIGRMMADTSDARRGKSQTRTSLAKSHKQPTPALVANATAIASRKRNRGAK